MELIIIFLIIGLLIFLYNLKKRDPKSVTVLGFSKPPEDANHVAIVDIRMPFISMVTFMLKWAIASIPAVLILFMLGMTLWAMFFGSIFHR